MTTVWDVRATKENGRGTGSDKISGEGGVGSKGQGEKSRFNLRTRAKYTSVDEKGSIYTPHCNLGSNIGLNIHLLC